jgi:hypothetical protein
MHSSPDEVRGGPSNTPPANTKIVASCIDTLHLNYQGRLKSTWDDRLEVERQQLLELRESQPETAWKEHEVQVTLGESPMVLRPYFQNGYRYRLFNKDLTLLVKRGVSASAPTVIAQLSSFLLWREGWRGAIRKVDALVGELLKLAKVDPCPSRIDLCADFQGWVPREDDLPKFVCRAKYRAAYMATTNLTGFTFGKGRVVARLYDKSHEIKVSGKSWMWPIWQSGGATDDAPVWRLEFQLRREFLLELDLNALHANSSLTGAWTLLSTDWLRHTFQKPGARIERCPTSQDWFALQHADFGARGGVAVRQRETQTTREQALHGLFGYLSSYAANIGSADLSTALRIASRDLAILEGRCSASFAERVESKARRHLTIPGRSLRDSSSGLPG